MSLKTWIAEFYPVKASSPEALAAPVTHSLRKWRGLTPENMQRHGIEKVSGSSPLLVNANTGGPYTRSIRGARRETFRVTSVTCALCWEYPLTMSCSSTGCTDAAPRVCPLRVANHGTKCDASSLNAKSLYAWYISHGEPGLMIAMLEKALAAEQAAGRELSQSAASAPREPKE